MATKKPRKWLVALVTALAVLAIVFASILIYAHSKLDLIQYNDGTIEQDITISAGEEDELDLDLSGLESAAPPDVPDGEIYSSDDVLNILLLGTRRFPTARVQIVCFC